MSSAPAEARQRGTKTGRGSVRKMPTNTGKSMSYSPACLISNLVINVVGKYTLRTPLFRNLTCIHKYLWYILSVSNAVGCNKDMMVDRSIMSPESWSLQSVEESEEND